MLDTRKLTFREHGNHAADADVWQDRIKILHSLVLVLKSCAQRPLVAAVLKHARHFLEHHYDVCYRRPGSEESVYRAPDRRLELPDCTADSFASAARDLLSMTGSAPAR